MPDIPQERVPEAKESPHPSGWRPARLTEGELAMTEALGLTPSPNGLFANLEAWHMARDARGQSQVSAAVRRAPVLVSLPNRRNYAASSVSFCL